MMVRKWYGDLNDFWTKSRMIKKSIILFVIIQAVSFQFLDAQTVYQAWLEYKPSYSLPKNYKIGARASWRTNLEKPRWRTFELRVMPEKKLSKHFDVLASAQFLETMQYESYNTTEFRLAVGGRWHFLPGRRVASGMLVRVEFRNVYKQEKQDWTYTTRPRLRIFGTLPLNEKNMKEDKVLYTTGFIEFFYQDDDDLQERYASRYWIRLGLGYKLNHNFRFELLYNRQDSKNTIDAEYQDLTKENIFVFSIVHKLNG